MGLKKWMQEWANAELAKHPVHVRDQIEKASKTWRGTFREIWRSWRRGR